MGREYTWDPVLDGICLHPKRLSRLEEFPCKLKGRISITIKLLTAPSATILSKW